MEILFNLFEWLLSWYVEGIILFHFFFLCFLLLKSRKYLEHKRYKDVYDSAFDIMVMVIVSSNCTIRLLMPSHLVIHSFLYWIKLNEGHAIQSTSYYELGLFWPSNYSCENSIFDLTLWRNLLNVLIHFDESRGS